MICPDEVASTPPLAHYPRCGRSCGRVRRLVDRRAGVARPLRRVQHLARWRVVGDHLVQPGGCRVRVRARAAREADERRVDHQRRASPLLRLVGRLRGVVDAAGADRLPLLAGCGGGHAARGIACAPLGARRLASAWPGCLDGGRDVRCCARAGARRDPDPALRLAGDLRLPGAGRAARSCCGVRVARAPERGSRQEQALRREPRPRARLRRPRRCAVPGGAARDHGVGADADRGRAGRQRAAARGARRPAAHRGAVASPGGGRRSAAAGRRAARPRAAPVDEHGVRGLLARALRSRPRPRRAVAHSSRRPARRRARPRRDDHDRRPSRRPRRRSRARRAAAFAQPPERCARRAARRDACRARRRCADPPEGADRARSEERAREDAERQGARPGRAVRQARRRHRPATCARCETS